jgi:hypothetical protein
MKRSVNLDIRQQERELFGRMAKGPQPMAPDTPLPQLDLSSSPDSAASMRAEVKAQFPGLTESQLDELLM